MPELTYSQALTANQQGFDPLTTWQYRYAPYRAVVTVISRATTVGVRGSYFSGSMTVKQKSIVQGGGTAGTTPTSFTTQPTQWVCDAGDLLSLVFDEVAGGTPTVDGIIIIDPV